MTSAEWDERWWVIREQLVGDGEPPVYAATKADVECVEQFGPRPEETR